MLLVVSHQLGGLEGDLLEDVVDERVHDVHASLGDASLGVDLLEDSVDVNREGLSSASLGSGLLGDGLDCFAFWCWFSCGFCHFGLVFLFN